MIRANKYFKIANTIETEKLFGMAKKTQENKQYHREIQNSGYVGGK